ncbi:hypothetical protein HGRIS_014922 [Hohenbuehelia grisea]|uniref:Uncharacterized protein n=1 Tax=Hohenbuehelia grisea TaxID=104357 RepID=A0ABR3IP72_9AGAR
MEVLPILSDVMYPSPGQESSVDDFAVFLLDMFDFDEGNRVIHCRRELGFSMCGKRVNAKTDVCLTQKVNQAAAYILLVQEDKRLITPVDAEAQLIAEACAAFSENNNLRERVGLPRLTSMTFPGLTLIGSTPTFYKITVTEELLIALATAQYPATPTIVERLVPPIPDPTSFQSKGMLNLNNRIVALQCFQAFKGVVHDIDI